MIIFAAGMGVPKPREAELQLAASRRLFSFAARDDTKVRIRIFRELQEEIMNIWLSGMVGGWKERERAIQRTYSYLLLPFFMKEKAGMMTRLSVKAENDQQRKENAMAPKVELFLDSGAYSAWAQGITIDIQDYIDFVKEHERDLALYAVLDVIGDAEGTLKNQKIMEKAGLNPLPCFHFGEDLKYLKMYVKEYEYLALGGLAAMGSKPQMFDFLDKAFDIICDKDGYPKIKIHGFGVTSLRAMKRYPWYSVDSTSWLLTARMGFMLVPHKLPNGDWDYLETLPGKTTRKVAVSSVSPAAATSDGHFSNLSKQWQAESLEWADLHGIKMGKSRFKKVSPGYALQEGEKWAGAPGVGEFEDEPEFGTPKKATGKAKDKEYVEIVEEPGLCNDYVARDIINAMYFKELESKFPKWPWSWPRPAMQGFGF